MNTRLALVTSAAARDLDEDLPPLETALREAGIDYAVVDWHDATVDWAGYKFALIRSTWDYTQRLPEFLDWAARADTATRLINSSEVIRWNTDKHYLGDLARAGVPAVPSHFIEPGQDAAHLIDRFLVAHASEEFVVKPSVGAGSRDAQRHGRYERDAALGHARRLLDTGRSVLLQPYLSRVDEHGETALIYFDGQFSHAIRKGPLLHRGTAPTRALFAPEHITPRTPHADELRAAEAALAAIPYDTPLTYARVDLIRDGADAPCVLELELTEPSLFFEHGNGAVARFVQVLKRHLDN
jgi:O-ureido-D-serine cyclo-ligase